MAKAYTKEQIVEAALMRFYTLGDEYVERLRPLYNAFYDEKGKTVFRVYASVTPEVIKQYLEIFE